VFEVDAERGKEKEIEDIVSSRDLLSLTLQPPER
jgi:hypothetical protein